MIAREKRKAMEAYSTPMAMTASSLVNIPRKAGMTAMLTTVMTRPWTRAKNRPWEAARLAFARSPAPRCRAIRALMPIPKPMAMALIRFCTG